MRVWTGFAVLLIVSFCGNSNKFSIPYKEGNLQRSNYTCFSLIGCIVGLVFYLTGYI